MKLNSARYDYWVSVGAQPSERVLKLVKNMPVEAVSEAAAA